jgi:hypothetical protein
MTSHLTNFGVPGIGVVPYGIHLCHFYPSRQELLDGLIPFFSAGLEHNELCFWLASPPLPASEIRQEIKYRERLACGVASGQLTIADSIEWYGQPDTLVAERCVQRLLAEEERALALGYAGLRIAGNASFMSRSRWDLLMDCERMLHDRLADRRIVACCSYDRTDCLPVDVFEVVRRHNGALDRSDQHWQFLLNSSDDAVRGRS